MPASTKRLDLCAAADVAPGAALRVEIDDLVRIAWLYAAIATEYCNN